VMICALRDAVASAPGPDQTGRHDIEGDLMMAWHLEGTYFETCNCDVACPCVFLSRPTEGECRVLVAWHVDRGEDGEIDLSDLNVAMAIESPGHMMETSWRAALYLDERASQAQNDALTPIFTGQAGGHPEALASFVGDVLGVASVKIDYQAAGRKRSLSIPSIVSAEIEAIEGQGGGEATISGHPLCIAPGEPAVVARSKRLDYTDHAMTWAISDSNGFYSPFAYRGG
jgi:hypothetical protein